jgi:hypothetical protein
MTYVIVMRKQGEDGHGLILSGRDPREVIRRLMSKYELRLTIDARTGDPVMRYRGADHRADRIIRKLYGTYSTTELAAILTKRLKRKFTKNHVIGRAKALGLCKPRKGKTNDAL